MGQRRRRDPLRRRRFAAALVGAVSVVLLAAASGAATDGFISPSDGAITLPAGGTGTVTETVHLDALPLKADIVLAFDTTGSMGTALTQAKGAATTIVGNVQAADKIPGARFAVTDFQDYPLSQYGYSAASDDHPYALDQPLTTDASAVAGHIPTAVGFGGDDPEAYNRALYEAYTDSALGYGSGV